MSSTLLDEHPCAVCYEWRDPDTDEADDPMISCRDCHLVVHAQCYGPRYIVVPAQKANPKRMLHSTSDKDARIRWAADHPDGAMRCALCVNKVKKPHCELCCGNEDNRAMKKFKDDDKYAHVVCVMWTRGPSFEDAENKDDVVGLESIDPNRQKLKCVVCSDKHQHAKGYPIQCDAKGCHVAYHAPCAFKEGWSRRADLVVNAGVPGVVLHSWCSTHTKADEMQAMKGSNAACQVCSSTERADAMLLCDACDNGYHMDCLEPRMDTLPEGDWYCPSCAPKVHRDGTQTSSVARNMKRKRAHEDTSFRNNQRRLDTAGYEAPVPSSKQPRDEGAVAVAAPEVASRRLASLSKTGMKFYAVSGTGDRDAFALKLCQGFQLPAVVFTGEQPSCEREHTLIFRGPPSESQTSAARDSCNAARRVIFVCRDDQIVDIKDFVDGAALAVFNSVDYSTVKEAKVEDTVKSELGGARDHGVVHVLRSLTQRSRDVLKIIIQFCGDEDKASMKDVFQECSSRLMASTEKDVRGLIHELVDHKVVSIDGKFISLIIPKQELEEATESV